MDVHVGYELHVPMSTFYNLPGLQESVVLYTQLVVRGCPPALRFCFEDERVAFRHLLKISGGAEAALSVLSGLSLSDWRLP